MPGVVVSWAGKCIDHKVQRDLCVKIDAIGMVSRRMHKDFFDLDFKSQVYKPLRIQGNVLLSGRLFSDQPIPDGIEKVNSSLLQPKDRGQIFVVSPDSDAPVIISGEVYLAHDVALYGIEFALFDPRRYNSLLMMLHQFTVSFVFIRCANPGLDGLMVQVCQLPPEHPLHEVSEVFLRVPELDLRYYLEHWIGELLGWVKHFYIPNLHYWAWIDNPGYSEYEQFAPNDQQTRDEIFFYLRDVFSAEAEAWKTGTLEYLKQPESDVAISDWVELEDERFNQLAWQEKRQRNRGT